MSRRRRVGRVLVFAAVVVYFSTGVAAAVSLKALARAPVEARDRLVLDATLRAKDLLLRSIRLGHRMLIGATKEYVRLARAADPCDRAS